MGPRLGRVSRAYALVTRRGRGGLVPVTLAVCACALCRSHLVVSVGLQCVYNAFSLARATAGDHTVHFVRVLQQRFAPLLPVRARQHAPRASGYSVATRYHARRFFVMAILWVHGRNSWLVRVSRLWLPSVNVLFGKVARLLWRPCVCRRVGRRADGFSDTSRVASGYLVAARYLVPVSSHTVHFVRVLQQRFLLLLPVRARQHAPRADAFGYSVATRYHARRYFVMTASLASGYLVATAGLFAYRLVVAFGECAIRGG